MVGTACDGCSQKPGEAPYSGLAADIWSLGVTLYCLVFGRVPFYDDNILVIYNKVTTSPAAAAAAPCRINAQIRTQSLQIPADSSLSPELVNLMKVRLHTNPLNQSINTWRLILLITKFQTDTSVQAMLAKQPQDRISLQEIKRDPWVTGFVLDIVKLCRRIAHFCSGTEYTRC